MKKYREYQATLHACGEDFPPLLPGWVFLGWSIHDGDEGPYIIARWGR